MVAATPFRGGGGGGGGGDSGEVVQETPMGQGMVGRCRLTPSNPC